MENTNKLHNVLTSLFIENQSGALEARLFDYEKEKQNNSKTKLSLAELRIALDNNQKEVIELLIDHEPNVINIDINDEYIWKSVIVTPKNKELVLKSLDKVISFMLGEDINRLKNDSNNSFQIVITIIRPVKNGPLIIKKVELVDTKSKNNEKSKKGGSIYDLNIAKK